MIPWIMMIAGAAAFRLDSDVKYIVDYHKRQLSAIFLILFLMGPLVFLSGFYLGYAAEGDGFWLYQKLYPQASSNQVWDELNEKGQFVSESGKAYTYYIVVSGKEIALCGEPCADYADLKEKLSQIRKENTVMVIDSFAVSSAYHSVENILNELGLSYEETQ